MSIHKKCSHNEINLQLKQKELKFAIKTVKDNISLPAVIVFWIVEVVERHIYEAFRKYTVQNQNKIILIMSYSTLQQFVHQSQTIRWKRLFQIQTHFQPCSSSNTHQGAKRVEQL